MMHRAGRSLTRGVEFSGGGRTAGTPAGAESSGIMANHPDSIPENDDDPDAVEDVPTTPAAHEATAQVEAAGQAAPVARRSVEDADDAPSTDFIGTRRPTDADTGSRMTI